MAVSRRAPTILPARALAKRGNVSRGRKKGRPKAPVFDRLVTVPVYFGTRMVMLAPTPA